MSCGIELQDTDEIKGIIIDKLGGAPWNVVTQGAEIEDWDDCDRKMNILCNQSVREYFLTYYREVTVDGNLMMELFFAYK